jgi:SAM-dependent methyltransferase
MHESVLSFFSSNLLRSEVQGKDVLEVGSYNENGSIRSLIMGMAPAKYVGSDMREGPGVDVVADISISQLGWFDVVCCAGTLEHMQDWRGCITSMKRHVKPNGVLLLTTVSPGFPLHDYPSDYWRFTLADMANIFSDSRILTLEPDPQVSGVFVKVSPGAPFTDLSGIEVFAMGRDGRT